MSTAGSGVENRYARLLETGSSFDYLLLAHPRRQQRFRRILPARHHGVRGFRRCGHGLRRRARRARRPRRHLRGTPLRGCAIPFRIGIPDQVHGVSECPSSPESPEDSDRAWTATVRPAADADRQHDPQQAHPAPAIGHDRQAIATWPHTRRQGLRRGNEFHDRIRRTHRTRRRIAASTHSIVRTDQRTGVRTAARYTFGCRPAFITITGFVRAAARGQTQNGGRSGCLRCTAGSAAFRIYVR